MHTSNVSFAFHAGKHQINSPLSSHSTNTINSTLQIETQIQPHETQNTGKASLAYQNPPQFNE